MLCSFMMQIDVGPVFAIDFSVKDILFSYMLVLPIPFCHFLFWMWRVERAVFAWSVLSFHTDPKETKLGRVCFSQLQPLAMAGICVCFI